MSAPLVWSKLSGAHYATGPLGGTYSVKARGTGRYVFDTFYTTPDNVTTHIGGTGRLGDGAASTLVTAKARAQRHADATAPPARVEVIVVRDPDGDSWVRLYLDGRLVEATEYHVDAGAGHPWADWVESNAERIVSASPAAAEALLHDAATPPGGDDYIAGIPETEEERLAALTAAVAAKRLDGE